MKIAIKLAVNKVYLEIRLEKRFISTFDTHSPIFTIDLGSDKSLEANKSLFSSQSFKQPQKYDK